MAYTQPTLSGYNSNPPPDDGSTGASNTVSWATHKNKLADPLKTFMQAVDTNVAAAFAEFQSTSDDTLGFHLVFHPRTSAEQSAGVTPVNYEYEPGNVLRYGDNTTPGTTDMTTAIQNAISSMEVSGGSVYIPEGIYLASSTLTITARVTVYGDGWGSTLKVAAGLSASSDVIAIVPAAAVNGIILRDFNIEPASGTPGRHGISVDITTYPVSYCKFEGIRILELGSYAFATLPNATPLTDGFFTSSIDRCYITGGIYLDQAGDSLRITNNTITGPRIGVYVDLVSGTAGGAHGLLIDGNNITSNGGTLYVVNSTVGVFSNNNCEMPTPSGVTNAAMVDLAGTASLTVDGFIIADNFIGSAIAGYDTIRYGYCRNVLVTGNYLSRSSGSKTHQITANASGTRIIQNDDALDETWTTISTDSGTNTFFCREFGGDMERTANIAFTTANKTIKWIDSAGTKIRGAGLSAIDDTFLIGCQDAPATNGHLLFYANGAEVGRVNPGGRWGIGTSGDSSALLALSSTTLGFLLPRMTTAQKNAISSPTTGLMVYDTTLNKACIYTGSWETITSS